MEIKTSQDRWRGGELLKPDKLPHRLSEANWRLPPETNPSKLTVNWFSPEHRLNWPELSPSAKAACRELVSQYYQLLLNRFNHAWCPDGYPKSYALGSQESINRASQVSSSLESDQSYLANLELAQAGLGQLIDSLNYCYQEFGKVAEAEMALDTTEHRYAELNKEITDSQRQGRRTEMLETELAYVDNLYRSRIWLLTSWQQAATYCLNRLYQLGDELLVNRIGEDFSQLFSEQIGQGRAYSRINGLAAHSYAATLLQTLGCQVYTPPVSWDAYAKTDLIASHEQRPDQLWLVQAKSQNELFNLQVQIKALGGNGSTFSGRDQLIFNRTAIKGDSAFTDALRLATDDLGRGNSISIKGLWLTFGNPQPTQNGFGRYQLTQPGQPVFEQLRQELLR